MTDRAGTLVSVNAINDNAKPGRPTRNLLCLQRELAPAASTIDFLIASGTLALFREVIS